MVEIEGLVFQEDNLGEEKGEVEEEKEEGKEHGVYACEDGAARGPFLLQIVRDIDRRGGEGGEGEGSGTPLLGGEAPGA